MLLQSSNHLLTSKKFLAFTLVWGASCPLAEWGHVQHMLPVLDCICPKPPTQPLHVYMLQSTRPKSLRDSMETVPLVVTFAELVRKLNHMQCILRVSIALTKSMDCCSDSAGLYPCCLTKVLPCLHDRVHYEAWCCQCSS